VLAGTQTTTRRGRRRPPSQRERPCSRAPGGGLIPVIAVALLLTFLAGALIAPSVGRAAPRTVATVRISAPPKSAIAGTAFKATDLTRNLGRRRTRRTVTAYLASKDRRPSRDDVLLGSRTVRPLRPGGSSRALRRITIPARTRGGTYRLIACAGADVSKRRYDRAACSIARRRIRILSATPANTAAPGVAGSPADGQSLAARQGAWRGLGRLSYAHQWRRCDRTGKRCADIAGATAPTYAVTSTDVGATIRVAVTASNALGAGQAQSPPTGGVLAAPPADTAPPVISGRPVIGETVTAASGTWTGTQPIGYGYQWQRCDGFGANCTSIPGAGDAGYAVAAQDVPGTLRVTVTASNQATAVTSTSDPVTTGAFMNPVFAAAATPDPFVLDDGGRHTSYWEFHTGNRFPILHSTDLLHWTPAGTAFADRPAWATQQPDWHPWAPTVLQREQPCNTPATGPCYVMYFTALDPSGTNCVGVATASSPGGPYAPDPEPLSTTGTNDRIGCGDAAGRGNIDPSPFVDADGTLYLYVATDRPGGVLNPTISVIPLATDAVHALAGPTGGRKALLAGDATGWEHDPSLAWPVVEGPAMVRRIVNGSPLYYLLYSGGSYRAAYGMGYAISDSPTAGFEGHKQGQILRESADVLSPGGGDTPVVGPNGATWMVYHGRQAPSYDTIRSLRIDRFSWQPGSPDVPVIGGPTSTPQPFAP
jgi:hypothetical protein